MTRQDVIADAVSNHWNIRDEYKGKSIEELRVINDAGTLPFAVCAINVTGDLNLGIMMRTAALMGAERFLIYGKQGYDRRSTVGAQNYIDVMKVGSIDRGGSLEVDYDEFFPILSGLSYRPIFFDTGGKLLDNLYMDVINLEITQFGIKPCLVFGNEGVGLPEELTKGQIIITIPQRGVLRSLNVSAAASIAIHHFSRYFDSIV